jgi:DNA polymerase III subunit chi
VVGSAHGTLVEICRSAMTEIRFYHLTRKTLEQALPELLEKTLERGWRAVVMAGSLERVEALTQHLWLYRADSFLPHGNAKDGEGEQQPVWLSVEDERPNGAEILFLTDGALTTRAGEYARVCEIFDGNDESAVAAARERWKTYKAEGHDLSYWQQGERGWTREV